MKLVRQLSVLAVRQVMGERADSVLRFLGDRFTDRSQRFLVALQLANERAWRSIEITLAGSSWWDRCKVALAAREEQAFRNQVQAFLEAVPLPDPEGHDTNFRQRCLVELRAARDARLLPGDHPPVDEVTAQAKAFARYTDTQSLLTAEFHAVETMAEELRTGGYQSLARYVALRPPQGQPLLVTAVRYFFRRQVESDSELSAGLTFQQLESLSLSQEAGFRSLHDALSEHAARIEHLLSDVRDLVADTRDDVREMKAEVQRLSQLLQENTSASRHEIDIGAGDQVRDLKAEIQRQNQQIQELYQAVLRTMEQQRSNPVPEAAQPQESAASVPSGAAAPAEEQPVAGSEDWDQVRQLVARCRALPKEKQRQLPALFRAVGKLKAASNNSAAAPAIRRRLTNPQAAGLFSGAAPVAPAEQVDAPAEAARVPPSEPDTSVLPEVQAARQKKSSLQRIQGMPVSKLFLAPTQPAVADDSTAQAAPSTSREAQGAEASNAAAPADPSDAGKTSSTGRKIVRRTGLSPLFGGSSSQPEEKK